MNILKCSLLLSISLFFVISAAPSKTVKTSVQNKTLTQKITENEKFIWAKNNLKNGAEWAKKNRKKIVLGSKIVLGTAATAGVLVYGIGLAYLISAPNECQAYKYRLVTAPFYGSVIVAKKMQAFNNAAAECTSDVVKSGVDFTSELVKSGNDKIFNSYVKLIQAMIPWLDEKLELGAKVSY